MACKTILRSVFPSTSAATRCFFFFFPPCLSTVRGLFPAAKSLSFNSFASVPRLNCTLNNDESEQGPPQEAVLKAISGASFLSFYFIYLGCDMILARILSDS